ncbi:MAG: FAD-dependent oxidoreductase [Clostridia bacterium]|nr:FAD-dependent oxidoreductase [Clostridia bacterium]
MFKHMFKPITIGGMEIKNRFVVPPMVVNLCKEDGTITDRFIKYHEAKAKGGFGLIITENYAISNQGKGFKYMGGLWNDKQMELNRALTDTIHKYDTKIAIQLIHAGRQTTSSLTGERIVAPSSIPDPVVGEIPHPLTISEIEEIIEQFGDAALRAKKAGFDAVDLQGAHGYLINQFMSPFSNKRVDKYGGNLINRVRFPIEIIKNIKQKVGEDYPIMFRISADELIENGLTIEDTKVIVKLLEDAGVVAIDVSVGVYQSGFYITAPAAVKHGWECDYAKEFKSVLSIPVIACGRINSPLLAENLIASEKADLIGMARASLCDPDLPNKTKEGKLDEIIECIGCRQGCSGNLNKAIPVSCVLNPLTGNEDALKIKETKEKKKVIVIGGGPGGMEAAIVARKRGHEVHIYEKEQELGGQLLAAAVPPTKSEITSFIVWQKNQLEKLGVYIHLGIEVNEELLNKEEPDHIIVATGAKPFTPPIKGIENPKILYAYDLLSSMVDVGAKIAVVGGGLVGAETAEHLARHNKKVTLIEMEDRIAKDAEDGVRYFLLKSLEELKVNMITNTVVEEIRENEIILSNNKVENSLCSFDSIVIATGSKPEDGLYKIIKDKFENISLVGDVVSSRGILEAVSEGYKSGLAV